MYYVGAFTVTKYVRERYKSDITFMPKSTKNISPYGNRNSEFIDRQIAQVTSMEYIKCNRIIYKIVRLKKGLIFGKT